MANVNPNYICINCSTCLNSTSSFYYELNSEFKIGPNRSKLRSGSGAISDPPSRKTQLTVSQALDFIFQVTDQFDDISKDFSAYRLCNGCMTIFSPLFQLYLQFISATGKNSPIHKVLLNGQLKRELYDLIFARNNDDDESSSNTVSTIQETYQTKLEFSAMSESILTSEENNSGSAQELVEVKLESEGDDESDLFAEIELSDAPENVEAKYSHAESSNVSPSLRSFHRTGNVEIPNQSVSSTSTSTSTATAKKKSVIKCKKCHETFRNINDLKRHSPIHYGIEKARCIICNCGFTTQQRKQMHMAKIHADAKIPKTSTCSEFHCQWCTWLKFNSNTLLRKHFAKKHFHCSTCQLTFPTIEMTVSHMDTAHGPDWMKHDCEFCDYKGLDRSALRKHQLRIHSSEGKKLTCEICGKKWDTEGQLRVHRSYHAKGKFSCDQCKVTYHKQINLTNHKLTVHPRLESDETMAEEGGSQTKCVNQCEICCERFITPEVLLRHTRVHTETGDERYKCTICNCGFTTSMRQHKHMLKMHPEAQIRDRTTKYSDFSCPICPLKLLSELPLKKHLISHHFSCPVCQQTFKNIDDINSHMDTQHGTDWLKYACELCEYKTGHASHLRNHRLAIHSAEEGKFTCEVCGKKFMTKAALRSHQVFHSVERPAKCDQCDMSYKKRSHLTAHKRSAHSGIKEICEICGHASSNPANLKKHVDGVHHGIKQIQKRSKDGVKRARFQLPKKN